MTKKRKLLFRVSIGLNLLLLGFAAWGMIKMNFVKEQVLVNEVQRNLVELEGLISHQIRNNWSDPNLVTSELGDVLSGIWLGMTTGQQLGMLSKDDKEILEDLYYKLYQYPRDELYSFADLTDEDKKNFEDLRNKLREVGLGLNITISANINSFIGQAEALVEKIESPLD
ncbi:hypothetical protein IMZ08_18520 [Bacillus luteolus]|uniref:Uncharacterized protein n=1 Tax=Litchfieldia luteola TaxID=682179 RepID=A0ABR9QNP6_9BACI|nr:hypothetical protein [Cytobacillus luteolus]MBE4910036.1 hypothetical protein [Cytobacillus luteolus]MBP1942404.1 hypothetical protein [Cytobacillus luteolus]